MFPIMTLMGLVGFFVDDILPKGLSTPSNLDVFLNEHEQLFPCET